MTDWLLKAQKATTMEEWLVAAEGSGLDNTCRSWLGRSLRECSWDDFKLLKTLLGDFIATHEREGRDGNPVIGKRLE